MVCKIRQHGDCRQPLFKRNTQRDIFICRIFSSQLDFRIIAFSLERLYLEWIIDNIDIKYNIVTYAEDELEYREYYNCDI